MLFVFNYYPSVTYVMTFMHIYLFLFLNTIYSHPQPATAMSICKHKNNVLSFNTECDNIQVNSCQIKSIMRLLLEILLES